MCGFSNTGNLLAQIDVKHVGMKINDFMLISDVLRQNLPRHLGGNQRPAFTQTPSTYGQLKAVK